ncbi:MAG: rod-binding protein [Mariprofundus sp.]|nr:rod-binding protein [Mariprofundus sp.]
MADLVEFVIDGILKREQMQQHVKMQQSANVRTHSPTASNKISFHRVLASQTRVPVKEKDEGLWKVSKQLEAVFVQQMMTEMRKSVGKSDFMPSGYAENVHASMMDDAIAQASAKRGDFGIAESIYRQLEGAQHVRTSKQGNHAMIQEISKTADKLEMSRGLAMEVNRDAH